MPQLTSSHSLEESGKRIARWDDSTTCNSHTVRVRTICMGDSTEFYLQSGSADCVGVLDLRLDTPPGTPGRYLRFDQ